MVAQRGIKPTPIDDIPPVKKPAYFPTSTDLAKEAKTRILDDKRWESTLKAKKAKLVAVVQESVEEQLGDVANGISIEKFHTEHEVPTTVEGWAHRDFNIDLKKDVVDNLLDELGEEFLSLFLSLVSVENWKKAYALESHNDALIERMTTIEHHLLDRSKQLANCRFAYYRELTHLRSQLYFTQQDGSYEVIEAQYFDPCEFLEESLREQLNSKIRDSVHFYYEKNRKANMRIEELEAAKGPKIESTMQGLKRMKDNCRDGLDAMWKAIIHVDILKYEAESWAEEFMVERMEKFAERAVEELAATWEEKLELKTIEIDRLTSQTYELGERIDQLEALLETAQQDLTESAAREAEFNELRAEEMQRAAQSAAAAAARAAASTDQSTKLSEAEIQQMRIAQEDVPRLEKRIAELEEELQGYQLKMQMMEQREEALRASYDTADETTSAELRDKLDAARDEITRLQSLLQDEQEAKEGMSRQLDLVALEAEQANSELEKTKTELEKAQAEARSLRPASSSHGASTLSDHYSAQVTEISELSERVEICNELIEKKESRIIELETMNVAVQTECDEKDQKIKMLEEKIRKAKAADEAATNRTIGLGGPEDFAQTNITGDEGGFWLLEHPVTEAERAAELELEDLNNCAHASWETTLDKIRYSRKPPLGYGLGLCKRNVFRRLFLGAVHRLQRENDLRSMLDGLQRMELERVCEAIHLLQESTLADIVPELRGLLFGNGFSKTNLVGKKGSHVEDLHKAWIPKVHQIMEVLAQSTDDVELGAHERRRTFVSGRVMAMRAQQQQNDRRSPRQSTDQRPSTTQASASPSNGAAAAAERMPPRPATSEGATHPLVRISYTQSTAKNGRAPIITSRHRHTETAYREELAPQGFSGMFADSPPDSPLHDLLRSTSTTPELFRARRSGGLGGQRMTGASRGVLSGLLADLGSSVVDKSEMWPPAKGRKKRRSDPQWPVTSHGMTPGCKDPVRDYTTFSNAFRAHGTHLSPSPRDRAQQSPHQVSVDKRTWNASSTTPLKVSARGYSRSPSPEDTFFDADPHANTGLNASTDGYLLGPTAGAATTEGNNNAFPLRTLIPAEGRRGLSIRVRTSEAEPIIRKEARPGTGKSTLNVISVDDISLAKLPRTKSSPSFLSGKIRPLPTKAANVEWAKKKICERDQSPTPTWEIEPAKTRPIGGSHTKTSIWDRRLQTPPCAPKTSSVRDSRLR
eukprot:GEMP01002444.1.p1 GENE.GEMP01002444.1~~GEMP01002444.1.p1  ORF type:complete len:1216 (+),score=378.72 GEMP01002444.1:199-3846(+)